MISLKSALQIILDHTRTLAPVETEIDGAIGRYLREDLVALEDSPPADLSKMDGFALNSADPAVEFTVTGEIRPGTVIHDKIGLGECCRICTGGRLPAGTDCVVPFEAAEVHGKRVRPGIRKPLDYVRRAGEDIRKGEILIPRGTLLGPAEIAAVASQGISALCINTKVRVVHLVTGSELVAHTARPEPGQIRDSNSWLIRSLIGQYQGKLVRQNRLGDDLQAIKQWLENKEILEADLILISGGASKGDYDLNRRALEETGFEIHFSGVSIRPGKPLTFGSRQGQTAFILPGNPAAHFVVFHLAVAAALAALNGVPLSQRIVRATLPESFQPVLDDRETYWPAMWTPEGGFMGFKPLDWQGSGDAAGLVGANALIRVPTAGEADKSEFFDVFILPCFA